MQLGLRSACEFVDLDVVWPEATMDTIAGSKRASAIVASWHDWTGKMKWDGSSVMDKYRLCAKYGDIVKIVGTATCTADNFALAAFRDEAAKQAGAKPLLAINMAAMDSLSRIHEPGSDTRDARATPSRAAPVNSPTARSCTRGTCSVSCPASSSTCSAPDRRVRLPNAA